MEVALWLDVCNYHVCLHSWGFFHVLLCESKCKNAPCASLSAILDNICTRGEG